MRSRRLPFLPPVFISEISLKEDANVQYQVMTLYQTVVENRTRVRSHRKPPPSRMAVPPNSLCGLQSSRRKSSAMAGAAPIFSTAYMEQKDGASRRQAQPTALHRAWTRMTFTALFVGWPLALALYMTGSAGQSRSPSPAESASSARDAMPPLVVVCTTVVLTELVVGAPAVMGLLRRQQLQWFRRRA